MTKPGLKYIKQYQPKHVELRYNEIFANRNTLNLKLHEIPAGVFHHTHLSLRKAWLICPGRCPVLQMGTTGASGGSGHVGFGCRVYGGDAGFMVSVKGFRVQIFRVWGLGFQDLLCKADTF